MNILKMLAVLLSISSPLAYSASCKSAFAYFEYTQPIIATINAGADMPVGSIIYSMQMVSSNNVVGITCDNEGKAWTVDVHHVISSTPSGGSFNFAGNTLNGDVFPTNVEGVGVALLKSNGAQTVTLATPYNQPMSASSSSSSGTTTVNRKPTFMMALVKTGPITPGSTVEASSFPSLVMRAVGSATISEGLPVDLMAMHFNGRIYVQSNTCQTHDKTVYLGKHEISEKFKGVGSFTEWVDSSIELTDCPAKGFPGYYSTTGPQIATNGDTPTGGSLISNKLLVSITANTGVIDASKGLININTTQAGAATGVGIQLGYGDRSNPIAWDLTTQKEYTLPTKYDPGNINISIPVSARYYQTESVVTPGKADGQVMFTINYQ